MLQAYISLKSRSASMLLNSHESRVLVGIDISDVPTEHTPSRISRLEARTYRIFSGVPD